MIDITACSSLNPMVKAGRAEWVNDFKTRKPDLGLLIFKCLTFEEFDLLLYEYGFEYVFENNEGSDELVIYYKNISQITSYLSISLYSEASRLNTPYMMVPMDISALRNIRIELPLAIYSQVLTALNEIIGKE